jgi:hypothetical protein
MVGAGVVRRSDGGPSPGARVARWRLTHLGNVVMIDYVRSAPRCPHLIFRRRPQQCGHGHVRPGGTPGSKRP